MYHLVVWVTNQAAIGLKCKGSVGRNYERDVMVWCEDQAPLQF
jgi:hypothetical protein